MAVKIPAPYASFLTYEVWEIPIVVAFLIFGWRAGVAVALINFLVLQLIAPGQLATGPLYNLAAVLLMLLGIQIAGVFTTGTKVAVAAATALGILVRVGGMNFLMAALMPLPPPVGFAIPPPLLPEFLLLIAIFNGTVALYTIPVAYWLARVARSRSAELAKA
ncbi:MAG: hypothetical protein JRN73_08825 [Nitrososphaerota archaeon]|nr:hypothetical protein [Nitrososphaerota archaeon]